MDEKLSRPQSRLVVWTQDPWIGNPEPYTLGQFLLNNGWIKLFKASFFDEIVVHNCITKKKSNATTYKIAVTLFTFDITHFIYNRVNQFYYFEPHSSPIPLHIQYLCISFLHQFEMPQKMSGIILSVRTKNFLEN